MKTSEVAAVAGKLLDLLLSYVRRDFGGFHFNSWRRLDRHGLELARAGLQREVQRLCCADLHRHRAPLRRESDLANRKVVCGRNEARQHVGSIHATRGRPSYTVRRIRDLDVDIPDRRAVLILDVAANGAGGGLCAERQREGKEGEANKPQPTMTRHGGTPDGVRVSGRKLPRWCGQMLGRKFPDFRSSYPETLFYVASQHHLFGRAVCVCKRRPRAEPRLAPSPHDPRRNTRPAHSPPR